MVPRALRFCADATVHPPQRHGADIALDPERCGTAPFVRNMQAPFTFHPLHRPAKVKS